MSKENKDTFEDDGRTIADMSGITHRNPFGFAPRDNDTLKHHSAIGVNTGDRSTMTRKERIWAILGAMKAVLLIGLCFAVGLAIVILMFNYL